MSESMSTNMSTNVTLRPAGPEDEGFIIEAYGSTRERELADVPWSPEQKQAFIEMQHAAQQAHYRKFYPEGEQSVILWGGRPVGRVYVARIEKQIRILDITVLPGYRNRRVGSTIIKELMSEGERTGKPVAIMVESYNPSLALFERLGFTQGETKGAHVLMEYRAVEQGSGAGDRQEFRKADL
jgi:GNAT superfamily N-acetyltransferase